MALSDSIDRSVGGIVQKKGTAPLPDLKVDTLTFRKLVLRKPEIFNMISQTEGRGFFGNQEFYFNRSPSSPP